MSHGYNSTECQYGQCDEEATIFDHGHWCERHYGKAMDFFRMERSRE